MGKRCIFTGHRALPADPAPLRDGLLRWIPELYRRGFTDFLCGGAMGFDLLAAEAALSLRVSLPQLRLILVLPCPRQDRRYSPADQLRYQEVLARADLVRYTSDHYYRGCMLLRDRVLAEAAEFCLCYLTRSTGGTAYTVRQAALRDVPLVNLADEPAFPGPLKERSVL